MALKIGISEVDITPPVSTSLVGYFQDRKSAGIHDPLSAQSFVFDNGKSRFLLTTCDLIALLPETVKRVKDLITRELFIPLENIFIHTTHTHTGPATVSAFGVEKDEGYLQVLPRLLAGSASVAISNLAPARIGFGASVVEGVSFNRRYLMKDETVRTNPGAGADWEKIAKEGNPDIVRPAGPIDPQINVGKIEDEARNLRALIVNFTCHLDTVGGNLVSADYPGVIRRTIRKIKGEDVKVAFFTGASGNINHLDFIAGNLKTGYFAHTQWMGSILAEETLRIAEKISCAPLEIVNSAAAELEIPVRQPRKTEVEFARRLLELGPEALSEEERLEWGRRNNLFGDETAWLKELLLVAGEGKRTEKVPVGALRINDAAFALLPGEVFVEFGLRIKAESRFKPTVVVELTNDGLGYLPTKEAFSQGTGYEERLARSSRLAPEAGDLITDAVLKLLASL